MYKVDYYTIGFIKEKDGYSTGNIIQYSDVLYTVVNIEDIPKYLQERVNILKGENKYKSIITNIQKINGHV